MTREVAVGHISDVHALGRFGVGWRTRVVSVGRVLDPEGRAEKLRRALAEARRGEVDHLVITGDLTETGTPDQYEVVAEALHGSGIAREKITLVPGNHDVYSHADAWTRALAGPLAAFAERSARGRAEMVEMQAAVLVPLDTSRHQAITRSAGALTASELAALARLLGDVCLRRRPVVLAMHHPPIALGTSIWHWQNGLQGVAELQEVLRKFRPLRVLHGHLHRTSERRVDGHTISGVPATVDDDAHAPRLTIHRVSLDDVGDDAERPRAVPSATG